MATEAPVAPEDAVEAPTRSRRARAAATDGAPAPEATGRKAEREYTVLTLIEQNIVRVGDYSAADNDSACWKAVDTDPGVKEKAQAAGRGDDGAEPPQLVAVLASRLQFEGYVLEPVQETRRVKR